VGPSHNYYLGRAEADVSGFVEYFCMGMADAFLKVRANAENIGAKNADRMSLMRELRPHQRQALGLFAGSKVVTSVEVAAYLGITPRQGREWCAKWVQEGFLEIVNLSKKARTYGLAVRFESGLL